MTWTCPKCNKTLKKKGKHPKTHEKKTTVLPAVVDVDIDWNSIESYLSHGPVMGGENGRLRALRNHDTARDWDSVYHGYIKISGRADDPRERRDLRIQTAELRRREMW